MGSILIAFNFAIFAAAMYLLLWPVISQYFYARAENLKKRMAAAATALQAANHALASANKKNKQLPDEIENRRRRAEENARAEQDMLIKEANRQGDYILRSAKSAAVGEEPRRRDELKKELVDEAFKTALEDIMRDMKDPSIAKRVLGNAVAKLGKDSADANWR